MNGQETLNDYERRAETFAHTQAQILKLINKQPGLKSREVIRYEVGC